MSDFPTTTDHSLSSTGEGDNTTSELDQGEKGGGAKNASFHDFHEDTLGQDTTCDDKSHMGRTTRNWKRHHVLLAGMTICCLFVTGLAIAIGVTLSSNEDEHYHDIGSIPSSAPTSEITSVTFGQELFANRVQDGSTKSAFGWSVSINSPGSILAVGDPQKDDVGRVYTYRLDHRQDVVWVQFGNELLGDQIGGEFGNSTDLSEGGDVLVVGARNHNEGRGQVSVFEFLDGSWLLRGQPLHGNQPNDNFGNAVSISGDGKRIAVAAARENVTNIGDEVGTVRVFEFDKGAKAWLQLGQTLQGQQSFEQFGFSAKLASSGNVVAIGAPFRQRTVNEQGDQEVGGAVSVYMYDIGTDAWVQLGATIKHQNSGERLGWSVDLSLRGLVVATGAPTNDENSDEEGQVRVYQFDTDKKDWSLRGEPIHAKHGTGWSDYATWFGKTVSLSSDGLKLVTASWCGFPIMTCYSSPRMYAYYPSMKKWKEIEPVNLRSTIYNPYSASLKLAKDDTVLVWTTLNDERGEATVLVYKPKF